MPLEKARFYRIARREAAECAAFLDDLAGVLGIPEEELDPFYDQLLHIGNMLTQLIEAMERRAPQKRRP